MLNVECGMLNDSPARLRREPPQGGGRLPRWGSWRAERDGGGRDLDRGHGVVPGGDDRGAQVRVEHRGGEDLVGAAAEEPGAEARGVERDEEPQRPPAAPVGAESFPGGRAEVHRSKRMRGSIRT